MEDISKYRQNSGDMTLKEVYIKTTSTKQEKRARLMCKCQKIVDVPLSKWQSSPTQCCAKCNIRYAKNRGYHGFLPRRDGKYQ